MQLISSLPFYSAFTQSLPMPSFLLKLAKLTCINLLVRVGKQRLLSEK